MPWTIIASVITAGASMIVAVLAHIRATRAQREQTTIDQAALINEAYQDVLRELRGEIERLQESLGEERGRHQEQVANLKGQIHDLEIELRTERDERVRLEEKVRSMEHDLSRVEKRRPGGTDNG